MRDFQIRSMTRADLPSVQKFTDRAIGTGYYSLPELEDAFKKSQKNNLTASLVLIQVNDTFPTQEEILGIRLTYAPGLWSHGKSNRLKADLWGVSQEDVGYFQSLFLDEQLQGQGFGKKLSVQSMNILKAQGARAVVCHSWKESPHDSSGRYLRSLGFKSVTEHALYWKDVDYVCTRCGKPCLCTAEEMIYHL